MRSLKIVARINKISNKRIGLGLATIPYGDGGHGGCGSPSLPYRVGVLNSILLKKNKKRLGACLAATRARHGLPMPRRWQGMGGGYKGRGGFNFT